MRKVSTGWHGELEHLKIETRLIGDSQALSKTGYVTHPTYFNFLSENFVWRNSLTRSSGKWCVIRVYKKTTYRSFTQLDLSNWQIRNYSSVQFLCQILRGNTLEVGTKSIPSVPSVSHSWGSVPSGKEVQTQILSLFTRNVLNSSGNYVFRIVYLSSCNHVDQVGGCPHNLQSSWQRHQECLVLGMYPDLPSLPSHCSIDSWGIISWFAPPFFW